jgi:hypothetical protein
MMRVGTFSDDMMTTGMPLSVADCCCKQKVRLRRGGAAGVNSG